MSRNRVALMAGGMALSCIVSAADEQRSPPSRGPIIDMHLHAHTLAMYGGEPPAVCTGDQDMVFLAVDPREPVTADRVKKCPAPVRAPSDDAEVLRRTLAMLERYDIRAVTTGPLDQVTRWQAAAPSRVIPAVPFDDYEKREPDAYRALFREGRLAVFAEISSQYNGLRPGDPSLEPYFALAEELDIPVGIHMGEGPPGAAYRGSPRYRAGLTSPFLLEEVLVRHPRLRVWVMHAASPLIEEMIAMLHAHPRLYVDVAGNNWQIPRRQFHEQLRRLVEAGFGKRILFGSDSMVWPDTIPVAIDAIETAAFLTPEQKRDIFHDNAARFLRLRE